jgi:DNA-directed RNA polymerase specialized sigma24 family protein
MGTKSEPTLTNLLNATADEQIDMAAGEDRPGTWSDASASTSEASKPAARVRPDRKQQERALVAEMLERKRCAWLSFEATYLPLVRRFLRWRFATELATVLPSDVIDEVVSDMLLTLACDDMGSLRDWSGWWWQRRRLSTWVVTIALRDFYDRLRHAAVIAAVVEQETDEAKRYHDKTAERWAAADHNVTVPALCMSDPRKRVVHVWYGDRRVVVYRMDDDGGEVGSYRVCVGWKGKLTAAKVRVEVKRAMRGGGRVRKMRTTKHRAH